MQYYAPILDKEVPQPSILTFSGEITINDFPNEVSIWVAYHKEGNKVIIVGCETGSDNTSVHDQIKDAVEKEFPDNEVVFECTIF